MKLKLSVRSPILLSIHLKFSSIYEHDDVRLTHLQRDPLKTCLVSCRTRLLRPQEKELWKRERNDY